jgi:hypothetical protein
MTGIDCTIASLLIDTEAPLDVVGRRLRMQV